MCYPTHIVTIMVPYIHLTSFYNYIVRISDFHTTYMEVTTVAAVAVITSALPIPQRVPTLMIPYKIFYMIVAFMKRKRLQTVVPLLDRVLKLDPPPPPTTESVNQALTSFYPKAHLKLWGKMLSKLDMICTVPIPTLPLLI